jgi:GST-like protein
MIRLYGCGSPNVYKILLMVSEVGLEWDFHWIRIFSGDQFRPEFLAINPNGKVPVIVDPDGPDGKPITVTESGAILVYLAEKTGKLLPTDARGRTEVMQWLMFQMGGIGPMFGQSLHFTYLAPPGNEYGKGRYLREANRLYDVMERRLTDVPYLAGQDYSIADIAAFPWVGRYWKSIGVDIQTRPHVQAWIDRIEERPAHLAIRDQAKEIFKRERAAQQAASTEDADRFYGR